MVDDLGGLHKPVEGAEGGVKGSSYNSSVPDVLRGNDSQPIDHLASCDCPYCNQELELSNPARPMTRREAILNALAFPVKEFETIKEVSARIGIGEATIYRYASRADFQRDLRALTEEYLGVHRMNVARALVMGACTPGRGQAGMQRVFWTKLNEAGMEFKCVTIEEADRILADAIGCHVKDLPE